jgi:hypothetical protein
MVLAWKMTTNTMSFNSDSSASDNTANAKNTNLKAIINIAWLMLEIDCRAHQHGQKTYSVVI